MLRPRSSLATLILPAGLVHADRATTTGEPPGATRRPARVATAGPARSSASTAIAPAVLEETRTRRDVSLRARSFVRRAIGAMWVVADASARRTAPLDVRARARRAACCGVRPLCRRARRRREQPYEAGAYERRPDIAFGAGGTTEAVELCRLPPKGARGSRLARTGDERRPRPLPSRRGTSFVHLLPPGRDRRLRRAARRALPGLPRRHPRDHPGDGTDPLLGLPRSHARRRHSPRRLGVHQVPRRGAQRRSLDRCPRLAGLLELPPAARRALGVRRTLQQLPRGQGRGRPRRLGSHTAAGVRRLSRAARGVGRGRRAVRALPHERYAGEVRDDSVPGPRRLHELPFSPRFPGCRSRRVRGLSRRSRSSRRSARARGLLELSRDACAAFRLRHEVQELPLGDRSRSRRRRFGELHDLPRCSRRRARPRFRCEGLLQLPRQGRPRREGAWRAPPLPELPPAARLRRRERAALRALSCNGGATGSEAYELLRLPWRRPHDACGWRSLLELPQGRALDADQGAWTVRSMSRRPQRLPPHQSGYVQELPCREGDRASRGRQGRLRDLPPSAWSIWASVAGRVHQLPRAIDAASRWYARRHRAPRLRQMPFLSRRAQGRSRDVHRLSSESVHARACRACLQWVPHVQGLLSSRCSAGNVRAARPRAPAQHSHHARSASKPG